MFKKSLILSAIALVSVLGTSEKPANAQGWNNDKIFCVFRGWEARVFVNFNAQWEHGVKLIPYATNYKRHTTYNNYYGRGAGGEWQRGSGGAIVYNNTNQSQQCYYIETKHKPSGANGNVRWQLSSDLVVKNNRFYKLIVIARDNNGGITKIQVKLAYRR